MSDQPNLPPSLKMRHLWPIEDKLEEARRRQMREGGLVRPKLHEAQAKIKQEARRFNVAACGRRFGKSKLAQDVACDYLIAGWPVGWFSPSYKSLADSWREIQAILSPLTVDKSTVEHRVELSTKGVLDCWSLDNVDAGRGRKYKCVVIDEAAFVRYLGEAWQATIRPTLTDYAGDAWFLSTPRGSNFFRTVYNWGQDTLKDDWRSWQMPSAANTTLKDLDKEIEAARLELPERIFRQEYLAEFIDDAGGVFRRVLDAATAAQQDSAQDGHSYLIGIDWGKYNDFTVLAVIDTTTKELCHLDRFNQIDYTVQIQRLYALAARFKTKTLIPEHNAIGIPLIEQLQREGYQVHPFVTTNASKAEAIDSLSLAIEKGDLKILDHPVLIAELQAYEAERLPSGMLRYSAPEGYHDDCLPEGTLIKTLEGYRPIEMVGIGDLVLTHEGRYQPVEQRIAKPFSGPFFDCDFRNQVRLSLSYNHPLFSASRDYTGDISGPFNRRQWVYPGDWCKSYRAVTVADPLPQSAMSDEITEKEFYLNNRWATNIKLREFPLDDLFAGFLGRFLADGNCSKSPGWIMSLAFNLKDRIGIERFRDYLGSLGVASRLERGSNNGGSLVFASKLLWYVMKQCYTPHSEKQLPSYFYRLRQHGKLIVDEWLKGDGWKRNAMKTVRSDGVIVNTKEHSIGVTTSLGLGLAMRDLALGSGYYSTIRQVERWRYEQPTKTQFWVTICDSHSLNDHSRALGNGLYGSPVRSIKERHYEGTVYNLQVAEDRSFVANGIVVHNCIMSLALAWHGAGIRPRRILYA